MAKSHNVQDTGDDSDDDDGVDRSEDIIDNPEAIGANLPTIVWNPSSICFIQDFFSSSLMFLGFVIFFSSIRGFRGGSGGGGTVDLDGGGEALAVT